MSLANKFGIPQNLLDAVKKTFDESTEYQNKVKAHMEKKGIKSLGDLSPEEKKKFFNELDAMHTAKNEAVTDYNPKSQGGTRKELLAKFAETGNSKDAEAARKAGATQDELKKAAANAMKRGKGDKGKNYLMSKNEETEIEESDLPSTKEKQKTVMVVHKTSGKELKIQASALDKYKAMGYKLMEETEIEEAESHQSKTTMKHVSNPTSGEKKAAKDIKPGIAGYRDRVAMLKSAKARGALKEDGIEIEEADDKKKEIEESDLPSTKEKQKTVMVVHKTSGKELKIQASALDKYKAMGYKLMEEVEDVEEAESHQSKTTMKHISKPTAGEKKAAKDIKPGIAGYRDRIAMLKSAKARGALKEDGTEIEEADDKKKAMASRIAAKLNSKASKMNADRAKTLDAMKRGQGEKGKNYLLSKNEEVEIEEAKSGTGYQLYHKDFSSAMAHAYDFAKQKYGMEIDPFEIDRNVAMGPKKPSSGKSNAYRLLDKTGKKAIQVQVANLDNKRYELNMYKEEVETIDERNKENADKRKAMDASRGSNFKAQGHYTPAPGPEHKTDQAHSKSVGRAIRKMSREEVEIEEARVKGKGYDNPENERKAPEGKVPFTSFQQGKQGDQAARLHATSAKGKFVKGKAQSAPQKEDYELTQEDLDFINSLNEKK